MRIVSYAGADPRGFTLAELLVVMAIMGLVMAGLMPIMVSGNQSYATGSNQIEAQQAARVALERMAREIRGAGFNPTRAACPTVGGELTTCPVVGTQGGNPTTTALRIQSDANGDGVFATSEHVEYRLSGINLHRKEGTGATQTIVAGIQSLTFTYLDASGVATVQPENIRSVQISVTAQPGNLPATWQAGRVSVTMSDRIRLRNR
jgi:prepilin-type N-terminal cleavage/methylation domain-containing protein